LELQDFKPLKNQSKKTNARSGTMTKRINFEKRRLGKEPVLIKMSIGLKIN
jgi:hypothetical protein